MYSVQMHTHTYIYTYVCGYIQAHKTRSIRVAETPLRFIRNQCLPRWQEHVKSPCVSCIVFPLIWEGNLDIDVDIIYVHTHIYI
jgi:hypothetical protein